MEKLTLENIASYLPYGLKVQIPLLNDTIEDVVSCSRQVVETTNEQEFLDQVKPVLRPMDLTKPIIVEGKDIIPIVELAKISYPVDKYKVGIYKIDHQHNACEFRTDNELIWFCSNINNDFSSLISNINTPVKNQLSLFKKLYEWKFDVDGLIEKGLAINCYDLETNPYNS